MANTETILHAKINLRNSLFESIMLDGEQRYGGAGNATVSNPAFKTAARIKANRLVNGLHPNPVESTTSLKEAAAAFNSGKSVTLKWNENPTGVTISRAGIADFFQIPVSAVKFTDVIRNGYPHASLTFHL